jgi:hypothetical protein
MEAVRPMANFQKSAAKQEPFCDCQGHFVHAPDWLAGDAVGFEPVSTQIPC